MTLGATLGAYILGLPLAILLVVAKKGSIMRPNPTVYKILDMLINLLRSVPFLILMVAIIPFTRFVVGTSIGSSATLVPLIVAATPFVARLIEQSFEEVDKGIIEAALSMGAKTRHIILNVYINGNYALPASLPAALALESASSLAATTFANILVVRDGNQNHPAIVALAETLKSEAIKSYITQTFGDAVVPVR